MGSWGSRVGALLGASSLREKELEEFSTVRAYTNPALRGASTRILVTDKMLRFWRTLLDPLILKLEILII